MENGEFLPLSYLFDSIGIIEKGIEKIYHYLLLNKRIDNLKEVCDQYGLTLKRGYKICSVLNDLELVQIYDRPMKIHLVGNTISVWQKIINRHIENLTNQLQAKKNKCEMAFDTFMKKYLNKFNLPIKKETILTNLDQARIICADSCNNYSFYYQYIYYYFVAKYIAEHWERIKILLSRLFRTYTKLSMPTSLFLSVIIRRIFSY